MLRMAGQTRIIDARHGRMGLQPARHGQGTFGLGTDAHRQRLQATQQDPGVEGRQRRTRVAQHRFKLLLHVGLAAQHGPTQHPALTIQILGGRMHDNIGAQFQRALQHRRGKGVVHHQQHPMAMRKLGQRPDVGHLGGRIGRALDEEEARLARLDGGLPGLQVGNVHIGGLHAIALEEGKELHRGAEHRARGNDMVTLTGQAHGHRVDGRHAGAGRQAHLGTFQRRQTVLEDPHGGIAKTRIDEAIHFAGELGGGVRGVVVDEAGAEIDGLGVLTELARLETGAHGQRLQADISQAFVPGRAPCAAVSRGSRRTGRIVRMSVGIGRLGHVIVPERWREPSAGNPAGGQLRR